MTGRPATAGERQSSGLGVLRNGPFLRLWLAQAVTQVGGNMVIYGLTVIIFSSTQSNAAVSVLLLTFLVPAVLFSAVAGVYVDRHDRRLILVVTNLLRAAAFGLIFVLSDNIAVVFLANIFVSTVTTFFGPAEASMIPHLVPKAQLLSANGLFTLTLNAAFALGFALLGPLLVTIAGPNVLILAVGTSYLIAAVLCFTLPAMPTPKTESRSRLQGIVAAEHAIGTTLAQLSEGLGYIRDHRNISWSIIYLSITASLIGVLGVLGPDFATDALGLAPKDFVVVVLPLGFGIVTGILILNSYGRYLPRRRTIEGGLITMGVLLGFLSIARPVTVYLQGVPAPESPIDVTSLVSLLSVVVGIAFLVGVAYALVAIPAQTQLQEDLPEEVRGRVFGVLNMLVSVASFLPIIIVGPISDFFGTPPVILAIGIGVLVSGIASVLLRGPGTAPAPGDRLTGELADSSAEPASVGPVDPLAVALHTEVVSEPNGVPADVPALRHQAGGPDA